MTSTEVSEVINARRTESLDAPSILKLVRPSTESLFGRVNVVQLIENSVLAVTLSSDNDEIMGHAAFFDYPNHSITQQSEWEDWFRQYYDVPRVNALNSLFMHYFVAKNDYTHGCAKEIVRTMFNALTDLHYCFLVVPNGVYPDSALAEQFVQLDRKEGIKGPDNCTVFVCYRHNHVPVLHVREARVEDHDDLVPIFDRQSDMLQKTYGDFFLAELIEAQDEDMKCLVTEVEGTAVGFMSVCKNANIDMLNECFEIGPFHGLCKPHPDDITDPAQLVAEKTTDSVGSGARNGTLSPGASAGAGSEGQGSRPASGREPRVKPRLSDSQLEGSQVSLSDHSDRESVAAEVQQRQPTPSPPVPQKTDWLTPEPCEPLPRVDQRFIPTYRGAPSVFCIQLFCIDERCEMRSVDFLPKAFEMFPDCDYCVITVPHMVPEFPLLQEFVRARPRAGTVHLQDSRHIEPPMDTPNLNMFLMQYKRVPSRSPSSLAHELYVFGRAGLLKNIRVRFARGADTPDIERLVRTLHLHEHLLQDVQQYNTAKRDQDGTRLQVFVLEAGGQTAGVAVVRRERNIDYIRSHYNIEDFIYFNHHRRDGHGHLHHYALNPVLNHYSKFFLKEILRLGHQSCLYYPLYPSYVSEDELRRHTLVTSLSDLVPVRARRQVQYPLQALGENAPSDRVLTPQEHYALNHLNRKLVLEPKVTVNARIVVVGASDTGISFLETFALCPHLRFNNLTLISPHGLPGELEPHELRDNMLPSSHCYSNEQYSKMALRAWVHVVYGKMTAINRKKKHVIVNGTSVVTYDHLVITTGVQYQVPSPTEADVDALATTNEAPHSPDRRAAGPVPHNLFVVNDTHDAGVALHWIERHLLPAAGRVLVYGAQLEAYSCVWSLLQLGVAGGNIHLVHPPSKYETACFNNQEVLDAVDSALAELGVKIHRNYLLAQWNDGKSTEGGIRSASFTSNTKPLRVECAAVISYYKRCVDYPAFCALNDACLVFDGRLVIDADFHTNDVSIRAAGPVTKFQRVYHADQWSHANFNSKEVGQELARSMLALFDPTLEPEDKPPEDLLKLIPLYRNPRIHRARLPGDFYYLHVESPGLLAPMETRRTQHDFGREIITGKPGGEQDYFRLHFNQYNAVETITCLSRQTFAYNNLICLYKVHEKLLNKLFARYDEGLISDLYSYFEQTWCVAVFHDRFADFREEIREMLTTRETEPKEAIDEKIRSMIEEDLTLSTSQRKDLHQLFTDGGTRRAVETRLLSFLGYNHYHLPMYARPGMV